MDIKESKEAFIAVAALGVLVAKLAKDGLDLSDAVALGSKIISDAGFREKLVAGAQGLEKIVPELKDLAASEIIEIFEAMLHEIKA
jgi:hypothetical protein